MARPFVESYAICREVQKTPGGVNLLGVFNDIYLPRISSSHRFFSFVAVNREVIEEGEEYDFKLDLLNMQTGEIVASGNWQRIEDSDANRGTNITTELNILFSVVGTYSLRFHVRSSANEGGVGEGEILAQSTFRVALEVTNHTPVTGEPRPAQVATS